MPRFFFHIFDDVEVLDDEGIELSDAAAARAAAVEGARALICDQVRKGEVHLEHRVEVADEAGERILILPFGEAVKIGR